LDFQNIPEFTIFQPTWIPDFFHQKKLNKYHTSDKQYKASKRFFQILDFKNVVGQKKQQMLVKNGDESHGRIRKKSP